ncbi:MAG: uracil-DNA glycosylase [Thermomicrobiales bacterium]
MSVDQEPLTGQASARPDLPVLRSTPHAPRPTTFAALCAEAQACTRCPTMAGRRRVLSEANGRPGALVCFVGEAPGRRGAERTAIPFSGDQSGRNFAALLDAAGLTRDQVFVTNAILCNPQDEHGRNRPPQRDELANCRSFLARQLAIINAPVVAPLGAVALATLDALAPHGLRLRDAVAHPVPWQGQFLFPLYHPGPRAQLHRSFAQQRADFAALGDLARQLAAGTFPSPPAL